MYFLIYCHGDDDAYDCDSFHIHAASLCSIKIPPLNSFVLRPIYKANLSGPNSCLSKSGEEEVIGAAGGWARGGGGL